MTYRLPSNSYALSYKDATDLIENIAKTHDIKIENIESTVNDILNEYNIKKLNNSQKITRGEFAILVDKILNPFDYRDVSLKGKFTIKK